MTSWNATFLADGDEPALLRLLQDVFGAWPKVEIAVNAIDHLRWKLEGGRHSGYRAAVVKDAAKLVGCIVLCIRPVSISGQSLLGTTGGDVAVLAEYRNKGVISAIQRLTLGTFGKTMHMTFGYQSAVPAVASVAMSHEGQQFAQRIAVLSARAGTVNEGRSSSAIAVRGVESFDERIDVFCSEALGPFAFVPARRQEYLNWRYCDPRAGVYTAAIAEEGGRVTGYAVASRSHGRGYIADVLALPGRDDVATSLIAWALASLNAEGVEEVRCWMPLRHPYRKILDQLGFETTTRTMDLMYRPLLSTAEELAVLRNENAAIHFTIGDTDLV